MDATTVAVLGAVIPILLFLAAIVGGKAQDSSALAPTPISTRMAIDQGIAYVLMFAALLLTYFLH